MSPSAGRQSTKSLCSYTAYNSRKFPTFLCCMNPSLKEALKFAFCSFRTQDAQQVDLQPATSPKHPTDAGCNRCGGGFWAIPPQLTLQTFFRVIDTRNVITYFRKLIGQRLKGETTCEKGVETASCDFLRFPAPPNRLTCRSRPKSAKICENLRQAAVSPFQSLPCSVVRGLLGTGLPDPTLESASPSSGVDLASIQHRFDIDSTSIS